MDLLYNKYKEVIEKIQQRFTNMLKIFRVSCTTKNFGIWDCGISRSEKIDMI